MHFSLLSIQFLACGINLVVTAVPDENNRLNSPLYLDQAPMPSMYLPLNCDDFKQKGIIAWMIHKGIDVPEEDRMLFKKCGNIDKDYIVGETFLFGDRNVKNMKRYSSYLRKILKQKPEQILKEKQELPPQKNEIFTTTVILTASMVVITVASITALWCVWKLRLLFAD